IAIDPGHAGAWRSLSMNLKHLPGSEMHALEAQSRVAEIGNTAGDWLDLTMMYARAGQPEKALNAADRVIALDPSPAVAWGIRADSLRQLGQPADAEIASRRVKELGRVAADRASKAAGEALRSIEEHPTSAEAWKQLAATFRESGRGEEAVS